MMIQFHRAKELRMMTKKSSRVCSFRAETSPGRSTDGASSSRLRSKADSSEAKVFTDLDVVRMRRSSTLTPSDNQVAFDETTCVGRLVVPPLRQAHLGTEPLNSLGHSLKFLQVTSSSF